MAENEMQYQRDWNFDNGLTICITKRALTNQLKKRVIKVCGEKDRSVSWVGRKALEQYLERECAVEEKGE